MELQNADDPFTVEASWEPFFFKLQSIKPLEQFCWDDNLPDLAGGNFENQSRVFTKDESNIYSLNVFGVESLESLSSPLDSLHSSRIGEDQSVDSRGLSDIEDIWELKDASEYLPDSTLLKSWDTFPRHRPYKSGPTYLSEAGSAGFDAALAFQASQTGLEDSGRVVRMDIFMASLFKLGMGWNSIFFRFNEQKRKFEKWMKDIRISGITLTSLDAFIDELLHCGSQVRQIRRFLTSVPTRDELPAALANLSRAVYILLYSLENQLFEQFKSGPSLLETQMLFRRSQCMIKCLVDIIETVSNATTEGEIISLIFIKCDHLSHEFLWLTDILHEVLTMTAGSWLFQVARLIGLPANPPESVDPNRNHLPNEIKLGKELVQDFQRESDSIFTFMPKIINSEHSETIIESARSLRFLRSFYANHPLVQRSNLQVSISLSLDCGFTWQDMDRIQRKAKVYEEGLRAEILKYNQRSKRIVENKLENMEPHEKDQDNNKLVGNIFELSDLELTASQAVLENAQSVSSHKLYHLVSESPCVNLQKNLGVDLPFGPPLMSALYLSFAPVISAQTRLINFSCLHLLFKKHKLREHLHLQWRFQLLGDGAFLSRLSKTLFDPDMHSGERKAGVARGGTSTGLRLGNRDTWPPASSELRLVLTGLLTECQAEYAKFDCTRWLETQRANKDLPGGLSFSIRELSAKELIKCKDPDSVEALDFLRLRYTPPPMLEDIITSRSLHKYDRIFKHLLRLLRLLSTVRGLIRSLSNRNSHSTLPVERRFCVEALHFVQAVSEYCFHVCVGATWHKFEKTLSKVEKCIDDGDIDGTIDNAKSLRRLREYHGSVLDQILFAMLLSKTHVQANTLLENIFGTILAFSLSFRSTSNRENLPDSHEQSMQELYLGFKKKVGGFIRFLRSLGSVRFARKREAHHELTAQRSKRVTGADIDSVFDHLLLRLDMTEFY
ncbi:hypothetical protein PRK78_001334 [Emydomyces testavorans]|uniref:Spindle pole body component n=1 Tax=Emydomyces testavorans TaxID=2070801 RepID=A0AAF0DCC8_9EURO|nr:hypothetical protein PRK78_001334 [Emydomyces testavorans]